MTLYYGSIPILTGVERRRFSLQFITGLRYRWLSDVRITDVDDQLHYEKLAADGWHTIAASDLTSVTPFSKISLLIDDAKCSFRCREFPVDMVAAKDLDEAISLDIPQWNPFASEVSSLSFFERVGDQWRVAVWLWPQEEEQRLLARLPDTLHCTHLMPEMAWFACRVQGGSPRLLINGGRDDRVASTYALVSTAGVPIAVSQIADGHAAARFWRGLGSHAEVVGAVLFCTEKCTAWVPDSLDVEISDWHAVRYGLFGRTHMIGVKEWSDPLAWRKQALAMFSLLLIWMLADATMLLLRTDEVNQHLSSVKQGAGEVLKYRDQVTNYQRYLQVYGELKSLQGQHEWVLAELSEKIPHDIWLNILQSGDGWVDIRGQGINVIRLVVLLEGMKGVKQALLMNDIRKDARSGLENFQLRLLFEEQS